MSAALAKKKKGPNPRGQYWAEWKRAWAVLSRMPSFLAMGEERARKAVHVEEGLPESSGDFEERDFTAFYKAVKAISEPTDLAPQMRLTGEALRRKQLVWGCCQDAGKEWADAVCRDIYGVGLEDPRLEMASLLTLRRRCANEARARKQKHK